MAGRVLVGIDGSEPARKALEYALEQFPEATVMAIHVIDPVETSGGGGYPGDMMVETRREYAETFLEDATQVAADHGRELETTIEIGRPSRVIVSVAEESGADHVVVGSRGRTGLSRMLLGSVAEYVVRHSPTPVTVVR